MKEQISSDFEGVSTPDPATKMKKHPAISWEPNLAEFVLRHCSYDKGLDLWRLKL
jgi:hypothetical protein